MATRRLGRMTSDSTQRCESTQVRRVPSDIPRQPPRRPGRSVSTSATTTTKISDLGRRETVEAQRVGHQPPVPGPDHRRQQGGSPPDCQRVGMAGHGVDRWLTHRKRGGGSGVCLAVTQWLDRSPFSPRDKQREIRCGDIRHLPGAPGLGPAPGVRPSVHDLRRLHRRHRPGEDRRPWSRPLRRWRSATGFLPEITR